MRNRETGLSVLLSALAAASLVALTSCESDRSADCGYTGEPGSAQYDRDVDRAVRNGCDSDEIVPYDG